MSRDLVTFFLGVGLVREKSVIVVVKRIRSRANSRVGRLMRDYISLPFRNVASSQINECSFREVSNNCRREPA